MSGKNVKKRQRNQWNEEYNGKSFSEVFGVPSEFTLDENCEPILKDRPRDELTVYVSRNGKAYHQKTCKYSSNIPYKILDTQKNGIHPCKICKPPQYDFSWYWRYISIKNKMEKVGVQMVVKDDIISLEDMEI